MHPLGRLINLGLKGSLLSFYSAVLSLSFAPATRVRASPAEASFSHFGTLRFF